MSNSFQKRLRRLHDAHQRGRESEGGPSGVYVAGEGADSTPKDREERSEVSGWKGVGARRLDDFGKPVWVVEEHCSGKTRHGKWTLSECGGVDHRGLSALDKEAPVMLDRRQLLYMDTETSGLGKGSVAFMIGIGFWKGDDFVVEQLLLEEPADEPALLEAFAQRLSERDVLVTFNGRRFDAPLLSRRFEQYGLKDPFTGQRHVDLLPLARRVFPGRRRYRLSSLERDLLSFRRVDDVPGKDIPPLWQRFCRDCDARPMRGVLEHNRHDIVSMAALLATILEEKSPRKKAVQRANDGRSGAVAERLERTYRLRGDFARTGAGEPAEGEAQWRENKEVAQAEGEIAERVNELREVCQVLIQRRLWHKAYPLLCEVVALAPLDLWGLEMLARYYRRNGQEGLAREMEQRAKG